MTLTAPPLQHQLQTEAFDLLYLHLSRPLQPCLRPMFVSAPWVPGLFRLLPVSLGLLCQREITPPVIFFPAPVQ